LITQILSTGVGLSAAALLPDFQSMLVVAICAAVVPWIVRDTETPGASETAEAVQRSRTVIGELR